jgi:hypothetical protein
VDIPTIEGEWLSVAVFKTRARAEAFCASKYNAVHGKVDLISFLPREED